MCLERGGWYEPANLSQQTDYSKTTRHGSLNVSSQTEVGVDVEAKVTDGRYRINHHAVD